MFRTLTLLTCCVALLNLPTVPTAAAEPTQTNRKPLRTYHVRGVVVAPYAEGTIQIKHEEIPGFMPPMTMPFFATAEDVAGLSVGDIVEFDFLVGDESRATNFKKIGRQDRSETSNPEPGKPARAARLREGDLVPTFTLTTEDGSAFSREQLLGKKTVLTFIFTRCPVPEFCPLLAKKFSAVQAQLGAKKNVQLLSITLDPAHDTPEVLRAYGQSVGADFGKWRFATGNDAQIEALVRAFAVRRESEGASLNHTLATALIGPDGKVLKIWRGNAWRAEEVLDAL